MAHPSINNICAKGKLADRKWAPFPIYVTELAQLDSSSCVALPSLLVISLTELPSLILIGWQFAMLATLLLLYGLMA